MPTPKSLSISLPQAQLRKAERLARRENRTMSELVGEALRRYEGRADATRAARQALALALQATRRDAARSGTDQISPRRINAEIAKARKARASTGRAVAAG